MSTERLIPNGTAPSEAAEPPRLVAASHSFRQCGEPARVFEELPVASIVSVSRPDTGDISPLLLSYTIQIQYKQFKWNLVKKASQVIYLHFALKRRTFIEELHEKQEQVKEWLQNLGIFDHTAVVHNDDESDVAADEQTTRNRNVPSVAALPIIKPALGGQRSISDKAKLAMQGYLNHFLGNLDIVNSREVCKFLEVSKMSFVREYGPKLKEGYLMVKHLKQLTGSDSSIKCCACHWCSCCDYNWKKVWAVLKPGFLALVAHPLDTKLLDIVVFDVLPSLEEKEESQAYLASHIKERNPLRYSFKVRCGNGNMKFRTTSSAKVREWVSSINDAGFGPQDGWCHPHRFGSFAPQRGLSDDESQAQWFIDGGAAFEAIACSIEAAKSEIFITGWWLCPELYMRRPFQYHYSSRLDALLETKAKEGVKIYILMYKEVPIALKINSMYSKRRLLNIHENIKVLRSPDHMSTGIYYWSHHEKLVIVDHHICFIGGLDLCFGRYDTMEHKVSDFPPYTWPGKDYYNPRESEPNSWEDTMKDELDREKYPRMPWHDVHCALWGSPCRDIARHFVQRWNHAKRNKAPNEEKIPLLMPQHHMVLPHYMGRSTELSFENKDSEQDHQKQTTVDFYSSLSPQQDIPLLLPQEAGGLPDLNIETSSPSMNHHFLNKPVEIQRRLMDSLTQYAETYGSLDEFGFLDEFGDLGHPREAAIDAPAYMKTSDDWLETEPESNHVVAVNDVKEIGPITTSNCQVIRSVSQWSAGTSKPEASIHGAYCFAIQEAKHFIYIENQFFISGLSGDETIQNRVLEALYQRILLADKEQQCFRVIVVLPLLPGFQGGVDDNGAATVRALMHWQYRTISWEKTSILYRLNLLLGPKTQDYILFCGLRSYGRLFDGGPIATSQVYVHSKLMIIDDCITFIGSSNINDRSLLGSRDSEIGVFIEDKEFVDSSMNGKPWKAGKFAHSLRCSLWCEHLGLRLEEVSQISDPIAEATYKDIWLATAKENTAIYEDVFSCIPNNNINSRSSLRQSLADLRGKHGHNTIDLGIAAEKIESHENGEVKKIDPMERLKSIRGHLVCFPLEFMWEEDLRPGFIESEFYAAPQVFH
ncbi:phospholipase D zeta 2-like isoform X2 [Momordica charantia]|uniref:Phospholipase n=1 Tax=Momordica charantia TaxID=3673 RepID=A0A6J1DUS1_MOMCH|nr:phospholipase D zeta 2-like isoform X2 [Momordica charantia]